MATYVNADERMAETGGKLLYGMNKDLADKAKKKWEEQGGDQMEAEARAWIEAITGEALEGSTHEALKSGIVLCNLVNAIQPGVCPKPSKMAMPFKQMENIGNYLAACTKLGVPANDAFQTVALFEDQDLLAVLVQITSLGRIAQKIGYTGPVLGAKLSEANKREFTEAQKIAGAAQTTLIGTGSHGTPGSQMDTKELVGSNISKLANVTDKSSDKPAPTPPPPAPSATGINGGAPPAAPSAGGTQSYAKASAASGMPRHAARPRPRAEGVDHPRCLPRLPRVCSSLRRAALLMARSSAKTVGYTNVADATTDAEGRLLYGMDKELAEKAAAKFDPKMEADARAWIEAILGITLEPSTQQALKSGIVLSNLVNAIQPGVCPAPSKMAAPFKQMENIGNYLAACTKLGQNAYDSFQTVALYENQDMMAVLTQITSLGRVAQKIGFAGPTLGVKLSEENKREFTAEQMAEAKNIQTFLGKGSHGTEGGNMSKVGGGKKYAHMADIEGVEGLGINTELGLVGKGAHGTAGGDMSKVGGGKKYAHMADVEGVEGLGVNTELGLVGKGAHGTAGGNMTKADAGRQIDTMSKVTGADGMGTDGTTTFVGQGSAGTAGGNMSKVEAGRDINKMANVQ